METIEIGGNDPIPEIIEAHKKALSTLEAKLSREGARVINGLYVGEAEIHGTVSSWAYWMDEYIKGLQGTNPEYSASSTREMLQLNSASQGAIDRVIIDLGLYRDTILTLTSTASSKHSFPSVSLPLH